MNESIPAAPCPPSPGNCGAFARLVSPGGGAFANLARPGGLALASPGGTPEKFVEGLMVCFLNFNIWAASCEKGPDDMTRDFQ